MLRWIALGGVISLLVLMVGPFQGAEQGLGLTDKVAHALAFGMITGAIFGAGSAPASFRSPVWPPFSELASSLFKRWGGVMRSCVTFSRTQQA